MRGKKKISKQKTHRKTENEDWGGEEGKVLWGYVSMSAFKRSGYF